MTQPQKRATLEKLLEIERAMASASRADKKVSDLVAGIRSNW